MMAGAPASSWSARWASGLHSDWRQEDGRGAKPAFSSPETSFDIQQTFDRLTCDRHTECQTTAKMSSHDDDNFTLFLGRRRLRRRHRGTLGQRSSAERKGDIHQYLVHFILFYLSQGL